MTPRPRPVWFALVVASHLCLGALVACGHAWCPECPEETSASPASSQGPSDDSNAGGADAATPPAGPLPACTWPTSLERPDSDTAGWRVSRTLLVCGERGGPTSVCASDSGTGKCNSNLEPCVMACGEHQYLVEEEVQMPVFGTPDGGGPYSPKLTFPTLPPGCTPPNPLVASAEATYTCCPCE
jgi:hypothetical protein